jgi:hypothetical protein
MKAWTSGYCTHLSILVELFETLSFRDRFPLDCVALVLGVSSILLLAPVPLFVK